MRLSDNHTHSLFSSDVDPKRGMTIDALCQRAIDCNLSALAVTDHLEINQNGCKIFAPLDNDGVKAHIQAAQEKYNGRLEIIHGVELAQPLHLIEEAQAILDNYTFDFIIGSVHCVKYYPDFYDYNFKSASDSAAVRLWELYLSEMTALVEWGRFDSLAHITYPYRYFKFAGREKLLKMPQKGREYFEHIFKLIIQKGIALEVNTSGIRQGLGDFLPNRDLVEFYYQMGGRLVTVGSDAHYPQFVGDNIAMAYDMLKQIGFTYITEYKNRTPIQRSMD